MTRYEAFIDPVWRTNGMAQLLVARVRANGRTEIACFLIDCWCLGVKDAYLVDDVSESELRALIDEQLPASSRETISPACAKKFVEGAVAYAQSLGFAPHRDFRKARRVLSGLDAGDCPETFTFGREGRPCFVEGPDDTEERIDRVCAILDARVGPEGYDVVLREDFDEEGDDPDDRSGELGEEFFDGIRERVSTFLDEAGDNAPGFYALSGLLTALHVCPRFIPLEALLPQVLPNLTFGKNWQEDPHTVSTFADFVGYWSYVGMLLGDTERLFPFDLRPDDFESPTDAGPALVEWAQGFLSATTRFPEVWSEALAHAQLGESWTALRAWADPEQHDEYFQRFLDQKEEGLLSLPIAVRTLYATLSKLRDESWPPTHNLKPTDDT